ncbi:hypothetical protein KC343_g1067 [Hortaea werneckii]|uniref:Uncharacterized protein n=1 Tax=Hortaea werneckii TaxID=91943 RepID=A0A3M7HP32_HORWE|nr:hypothetical protein KC338_g5842 [Hortaea werneckii]KAI6865537.1 hypothetical protein KC323_g4318 [Hortaea werneckii]KAI7253540.1 hypothetical protein KC352_g12084 [Hortaea werneckii]KAI7349771.1 hypothetical protein KC320_g5892 [Hortaea werneckii]KAI7571189.1 hypothetical protein KC317_g1834 [Hortaea werneckii]
MLSKSLFAFAACAVASFAQNTTSASITSNSTTPTASILVAESVYTTGFAASVVDVDACDTTYQIVCTDRYLCSGYALTMSITEGGGIYKASYETSAGGVGGELYQTCSLGTASSVADCEVTLSLSVGGEQTATTTEEVRTGREVIWAQYPITAGAGKLTAATGSCTASRTAASGGSVNGASSTVTFDSAAMATGFAVKDVYKVLVVPAAAAAAAGVLI